MVLCGVFACYLVGVGVWLIGYDLVIIGSLVVLFLALH